MFNKKQRVLMILPLAVSGYDVAVLSHWCRSGHDPNCVHSFAPSPVLQEDGIRGRLYRVWRITYSNFQWLNSPSNIFLLLCSFRLLLMSRACYNPSKALSVWTKFQEMEKITGRVPQFLSTHPSPKDRFTSNEANPSRDSHHSSCNRHPKVVSKRAERTR